MDPVSGEALHPFSLDNARIDRYLMDLSPDLKEISIIGVGGLANGCSFNCMINAGLVSLR